MKKTIKTSMIGLCLATGLSSFTALADSESMYAVTITNITSGQTITPILVTTHKKAGQLFTLGQPATAELVAIAESGNTAPLQMKLESTGMSYDAVSTGGLLGPGESVTVNVKAMDEFSHISLAGMLLPTNDGFIAVNGVKASKFKRMTLPAYDAGSEMNDELCANIPGPHCGGSALSAEDGEGFVHIHSGIHGHGDLMASKYDWRNPAIMVTIKRMK
ncbi:MAG: spondin domain-containing protein [Gammaproteobacteria bacterium]|nr:spondin domain-containing protein [Gammaproteobacteria bacterium]MDH5801813.1 spondin domain-containing protein [Gammaproteobacteria bacterium]